MYYRNVFILAKWPSGQICARVDLLKNVREKFLSIGPISLARVHRDIYYLTSRKMKGRRKCWKIKMKKRRKVKVMKRSRKSEKTLNSCMRHGDDHGME